MAPKSQASYQGFFRVDTSIEHSEQPSARNVTQHDFACDENSLLAWNRKPRGQGSKVAHPWDENMSSFHASQVGLGLIATPEHVSRSTGSTNRTFGLPSGSLPTPETPSNMALPSRYWDSRISRSLVMSGGKAIGPSVGSFDNQLSPPLNPPFASLDFDASYNSSTVNHERTTSEAMELSYINANTYSSLNSSRMDARYLSHLPARTNVFSTTRSSVLLSPLALGTNISSFDDRNVYSESQKENFSEPYSRPASPIERQRVPGISSTETVQQILKTLQRARLSLTELFVIALDDSAEEFGSVRAAFFADHKSRPLVRLLELFWSDRKGSETMKTWFKPHAVDLICEIIHDEMDAAKPALFMSTNEVTPEFIAKWDINDLMEPIALRTTPVWSRILDAATESKESRLKPITSRSRNRRVGRNVISSQVHYLRSFKSCKVQIGLGLLASYTNTSREFVNVLNASCLTMSFPSMSKVLVSLANRSIHDARYAANTKPVGGSYDNVNMSTSIFVEQRPSAMNKVQSGTFSVLYQLYNACLKDMEAAPMMKRLKEASPLVMADLRPSSIARSSFHSQKTIKVAQVLTTYVKSFSGYLTHPKLQYTARRRLPDGYKTIYHPLRISTIEEASVKGNLLNHDDIFVVQLKRSDEQLSKYMIPAINDQLTNARNRTAQAMRNKDLTPWTRREVLALAFGTFHLIMNLIWMLLHVHRGTIKQSGSLTHLFAVLEKTRLGAEHPDFHTLLSTLTQVLDGLLLNAWRDVCGYPSLDKFAASKPTAAQILELSRRILRDYATPKDAPQPCEKPSVPRKNAKPKNDSTCEASDEDSDDDDIPGPANSSETNADTVHDNVVLLTRDLLYVTELVHAVSDGDFGRVEDILPDLACIFRAGGSNNYSTEILHFIFNLKEVWTPEFANIMRDNMIVNVSGKPGHGMGADMNIEHIIGYLKKLFASKGIYSSWDRMGNISAAICQLQTIKIQVTKSMHTNYQGSMHKAADTSALVWRIADKARELKLQEFVKNRDGQSTAKPVPDLRASGREKFASASLATFNKKLFAMIDGKVTVDEEDDLPPIDFGDREDDLEVDQLPDEEID